MTLAVEIAADGAVLVRTGKVEIGQGLHTALAQIVADELGVDFGRIRMLPVHTGHSPDQGVTSGSLSVQEAGAALRLACAALRSRPDEPVVHRLVGTTVPRHDLPALLEGQGVFIHDLQPPGLLHGRVLHPPRTGAELLACDLPAVRDLAGVRWAGRSGTLSGVVADTSARADAALQRLADGTRWQHLPLPDEGPDELQHLPATTRCVAAQGSAVPAALTHLARYARPWLLHASIGPSCALACWPTPGTLQVWTHSQGIFNLRRDLALAFGLQPADVWVQHVPGAGCYGHNGADDVAYDAAWLARQAPGSPVRVLWSRADELSQSPQGPAMAVQVEIGHEADGRITHWHHDLWSPGHSRRPGRSATPALLGAWQVEGAPEPTPSIDMPLATGGGAERNAIPPYAVPALRVQCHSVTTQRRSSAMRGLGALGNVFAAECAMDEVAHHCGIDPLAQRLRHLQHEPRALAVLEAVARLAGWGHRTRAEATGHGLACARYKHVGAWCAVIAEVHAGAVLQVRRLWIAVDVGTVVNPDGVVNQIEGGAIQATSWVLKEAAAPAHAGWADYPILRFSEVPAVEVVVVPSTQPSVGSGEASLGPTAAAIANALHDALGVRVRDLPLTPERIVAAMTT